MRAIAKARCFLASLFRRRRTEEDLDDELRYHLEEAITENIRAGMSAREAKFAAQRLLGTVSVLKEECRDAWGIAFFETLARDLRFALQIFRRTPLFTLAALITLGLGIGANATVFTVIENVLLHPLQVRDSGRVLFLNWGDAANMSFPNYADFRDRNETFSALVAYRLVTTNVSLHPRDNAYAVGYEATGNYFAALGVTPEQGRFFGPSDDDKPGAHPVIVLSHRFWLDRFAGDVHAIGGTVRISGFPFTIIGVAPPSFVGTEVITSADYWVPMSMVPQVEPGSDWMRFRGASNIWVLGRLRPGISRAQAEADLDRTGASLAREYPSMVDSRAGFRLSPPGLFGNNLRRPVESIIAVFAVVAGLVLLLACLNLAGMLLARAADRRREVGIRMALGAGRWQLIRQLMTESLLLATAGGAFGFALTFLLCRLIGLWRPVLTLPLNTALHPDSMVLGCALASVLCAALLFGLAPALHVVRAGLASGIRGELVLRSLRRAGARDLMVAAQIAISVVLAICAALVIHSAERAHSVPLGIRPERAAAVSVDLHVQGYDRDRIRAFNTSLLARAKAIPGVESAGIVNFLPLTMRANNGTISRPDRPVPRTSDRRSATIYNISPGYFAAAGTRVIAGRDFDSRDHPGAAFFVIINEACGHALYGAENPVGRRVRLGENPSDPGFEVAGVVEDGKYEYLSEKPHPAIFMPLAFTGGQSTTLVARGRLPPAQMADLLRKTVLELDPELTVVSGGSLTDQLALALLPVRIVATVLGAFGFLALGLAATGLFALVAYAVSRRTREIGIRMTLGARHRQVLSSILMRTAMLCLGGVVTGVLLSLPTAKMLSVVLYGVSPRDPATYLYATLVVASVALLGCWHPSLRAIRINPAVTLREE